MWQCPSAFSLTLVACCPCSLNHLLLFSKQNKAAVVICARLRVFKFFSVRYTGHFKSADLRSDPANAHSLPGAAILKVGWSSHSAPFADLYSAAFFFFLDVPLCLWGRPGKTKGTWRMQQVQGQALSCNPTGAMSYSNNNLLCCKHREAR